MNRSKNSRSNLDIPTGASPSIISWETEGGGKLKYAEIRMDRQDVEFKLHLDAGKLGNTMNNLFNLKNLRDPMAQGWRVSNFDPINNDYTAVLAPATPICFYKNMELIVYNRSGAVVRILEAEILFEAPL